MTLSRWRRYQGESETATVSSGTASKATSLPLISIIFLVISCLLMISIGCWREWVAYGQQIDETKTSVSNLANSLARDAEATIEVADTIVAGTVMELEHEGANPATLAMLNAMLPTRVAAITRLSSILVVGADGQWLATSLPKMGHGLADRTYFQHARDNPDRGPFISDPVRSRSSGRWVLTVSRRFQSPTGEFAGIVVATLEIADFVRYYAEMDLGAKGSITLLAPSGMLLARYPWDESSVGRNLANAMVFSRLKQSSSGSYETASPLDGVHRFSGYRQSDRFPLVVVASVSVDFALRGWRTDAAVHLVMIGFVTAAIGLLTIYQARQNARSRAAERQIRESEVRYRIIAEKLNEANERASLAADSGAIGIWDWDVTTNTLVWDAWMYRLYGMQPSDDAVNYELWQASLHPDDRDAAEQALLDGVAGTQAFNTEFRVIWGDGSVHHIRGCGQPTRDLAGNVTRMVGANWDVTDARIEAQQRAIIVEAAPNGMLIVDEFGMITLANSEAQRIFGYPTGALFGLPVEMLMPGAFRAAHDALPLLSTSEATDLAVSAEPTDLAVSAERQVTGFKRDGSRVTIEIMLSSVTTRRGRIVVVSLLDVTERVHRAAEKHEMETRERLAAEATNAHLDRLARHLAKARDRAEQANRAKTRFLAGMSHELRTPLNGILGYARLLHMEGGLNPSQAARVDAMLGAGHHLLEMITGVLDLSQIEDEHFELQAVEVDLQAIAAACLDLVRPLAQSKGLALSMASAHFEQRQLIGDPTRLRQILLNLMGNAVKFTRNGGIELRLIAAVDDSLLRIEVRDTGPGIAVEQRGRLFQDFDRLDSEASSLVEGAGLGLSLSARLANLMGGRLGHDDNPGGGSVFWLELPWGTARAAAVPSAEPADSAPATQAMRQLRVLVVDDVLMNREIASAFLCSVGHEVTCADGGAAAVAAVEAEDFDVVLMDVRMPDMDGLEATRRIRSLPGGRGQLPIVALTAQAFAEQVAEVLAAGMDSYLSKPFAPDTLLAAVSSAVATKAAASASSERASAARSAPEKPVIGAELRTIDPAVFDRTAGFLEHDATGCYLQTILERSETLLQSLRETEVPMQSDHEFAESVHALVGSAGLFGLERLVAVGRRFEAAVQAGGLERSALTVGLIAALEVTLPVLRELTTASLG